MTDSSQPERKTWKPGLDTAILDAHMASAMKRVAGAAGVAIAFEKGMIKTQSDAAVRRLAGGLSQDVIAEMMLTAFHAEARAAFAEAREALDAKASMFLTLQGLDEEERLAALARAGAGFAAPSAAAFEEVSRAYARGTLPPVTQGAVGAAVGFGVVSVTVGAPPAALCVGLVFGSFAYLSAKGRVRRQAEEMVRGLPRGLYSLLVGKWNAGLSRYADEISAVTVREEIEAAVLSV